MTSVAFQGIQACHYDSTIKNVYSFQYAQKNIFTAFIELYAFCE